jgi:GT2 family glycosyltransferase
MDMIIMQNAECYHAGDIIGYAKENLKKDNYIAFPCYSLSKDDTLPPQWLNNRCASHDGDSAWYNHPTYRPVGYHFCAAITADNLRKLNGFDERFKDGKDYEDNFLLHQIRSLGLRIDIPAEPYVFHQWHYSTPRAGGSNAELYHKLIQTEGYRAVHLITQDL